MTHPICAQEPLLVEPANEDGALVEAPPFLAPDGEYPADDCYCGQCYGKQGCGHGGKGHGKGGGCCNCSRFWVRGEFLLWWTDGMQIPPLVTTSNPGTPLGDQGVLGLPSTRILLGNEDLFTTVRAGGRLRMGWWMDDCQQCGIEGDFLGLERESFGFRRTCLDNPILARPFFNVDPMLPTPGPGPDAQIVCSDGVLQGAVTVDAHSNFWSAGLRRRCNLCSTPFGCGDKCGSSFRKDFMLGYRFLRLNEDLSIREELNTVATPVMNLDLLDRFETNSDFHGAEFGYLWEWQRGRYSLETRAMVALGWSHHEVDISGRTHTATHTPVNNMIVTTRTSRQGALLAQPSNIGHYEKDSFAVVPQLDLTLGYQITPDLRFTFGYSMIYWSSVVRPGDQIDLTVNGKFLDPTADFEGPLRPAFNFNESGYWAQGLNFGLDLRL